MFVARFIRLAGILGLLFAASVAVQADDHFTAAGPSGGITLSEVSYNNLMQRLEALEASTQLYAPAGNGWNEVDIIEKPTHKWSGRIHFDYWPMPDSSPLANTLESFDSDDGFGDPTDGPDDFIGFRRLRFGVKGQINETMEYKIEMEFAAPNNLAFKDAYLGWNELPVLRTL
jgi:phosphate-selective porin OprO/OprP